MASISRNAFGLNSVQATLLQHIADGDGSGKPVVLQPASRASAEVLEYQNLISVDGGEARLLPLGRAWLDHGDPEASVLPNRCGHNEPGGVPGSFGQLFIGTGSSPFCARCAEPMQMVELREDIRIPATLSQDWGTVVGALGTRMGDVIDATDPVGGQCTIRIVDIHGWLWWAKTKGPGRLYMNLSKNQKTARADLPPEWRERARGDAQEYHRRSARMLQLSLAKERMEGGSAK